MLRGDYGLTAEIMLCPSAHAMEPPWMPNDGQWCRARGLYPLGGMSPRIGSRPAWLEEDGLWLRHIGSWPADWRRHISYALLTGMTNMTGCDPQHEYLPEGSNRLHLDGSVVWVDNSRMGRDNTPLRANGGHWDGQEWYRRDSTFVIGERFFW
jgi:hypothetical protein